MQQQETNDGGVPGLAANVMLKDVAIDGQADRRHEPIDPRVAQPDRAAHEKPSQRLSRRVLVTNEASQERRRCGRNSEAVKPHDTIPHDRFSVLIQYRSGPGGQTNGRTDLRKEMSYQYRAF